MSRKDDARKPRKEGKMIDLATLLPRWGAWHRVPGALRPMLLWFLRWAIRERYINSIARTVQHRDGGDFVDSVLEHFQCSCRVQASERENIPASGTVLIVANHPIGSLDGLALLQLVLAVRPDVRVVANRLLSQIEPVQSVLLPVNNMSGDTSRGQLQAIRDWLAGGGAVIMFPAGVVSRLGMRGVRDRKWNHSFVRFARSVQAPILPVYIKARCSMLFYLLSLVVFKLSTLWLVREMFKCRGRTLDMRIGKIIPHRAWGGGGMHSRELAQMVRRHIYRLASGGPLVFATEDAIAHPEDRRALREEVAKCTHLGKSFDGKQIYLADHRPNSCLMRELGRVREISFRAVGEGTGKRRDIGPYDRYYQHLMLWDDEDLEVVGSYRVADVPKVAAAHGIEGLYSSTLFKYRPGMQQYFDQGLELGRSFVQPRYWGRRSLDYLWHGIGMIMLRNPQLRYLFGAVSISDLYPERAKAMLVSFYRAHFGGQTGGRGGDLMEAIHPLSRSLDDSIAELGGLFPGDDYQGEFRMLRKMLAQMNLAVPTLYKQYSELCEPGGVIMPCFGLDIAFSNAVDACVIVDLQQVKASKKSRYMDLKAG